MKRAIGLYILKKACAILQKFEGVVFNRYKPVLQFGTIKLRNGKRHTLHKRSHGKRSSICDNEGFGIPVVQKRPSHSPHGMKVLRPSEYKPHKSQAFKIVPMVSRPSISQWTVMCRLEIARLE